MKNEVTRFMLKKFYLCFLLQRLNCTSTDARDFNVSFVVNFVLYFNTFHMLNKTVTN